MKSLLRGLSLCQRLKLKLDQMTKPKTRERLKFLKGSNFATYSYRFKISDLITATSFKIKVFQMLLATAFLQERRFDLNFQLAIFI